MAEPDFWATTAANLTNAKIAAEPLTLEMLNETFTKIEDADPYNLDRDRIDFRVTFPVRVISGKPVKPRTLGQLERDGR